MNKGVMTGLAIALLAALPTVSAEPVARRSAALSPAFNQIVRHLDAGVSRTGEFERVSAYLSHSNKVLRAIGKGQEKVRFAPLLPHEGYYRVYGWWPLDPQAGQAELRVATRAGDQRVPVEMKQRGGQWQELGTFAFAGGERANIELVEQQGVLLVDAIRIEFVGAVAPALQLSQNKLPLIEAGVSYRARIPVSGGVAPYRFTITDGALPRGMTLDAKTGELRGRAAEPGHHEVVLAVIDGHGNRGSGRLQLDVIESETSVAADADSASQWAGRSVTSDSRNSKLAQPTPANADLSSLISALAATPDGEWLRANLNAYSDVWAPAALRPLDNGGNPSPSKIIGAWSGFAWDRNRGELWLYGGGHANYSGNDVYRWRGSTRMWERASLPSEVTKDMRGNFVAIDGPDRAPPSAHTYDNNIFLPLHDRLLVFGGAAYNNGGMFLRAVDALTSRRTGPYLFDPNRADPNKVGGSTGSHVKRVGPYPEIVGGDMWQNRDMFLNIASTPKLPGSHTEGCTAYAEENGRDVVYVGVRNGGGTATTLFRYVINDLNNPGQDSWQQVGGYWDAPQGQTACAYDAQQKLFVRTGSTTRPFLVWNLNTPGPTNYEFAVVPQDPSGAFTAALAAGTFKMRDCGIDFDEGSRRYGLWCTGNQLYWLTPPATVSASGWTIEKIPTPIGAAPPFGIGTGVLGKWKYIPNLNAFMGLLDVNQGNIWIYKPFGWTPPEGDSNIRPSVSLTAPQNGQEFVVGEPITISADASDVDGTVVRVEFYDGSTLLATDTSAPYQFDWLDAPTGNRTLSARAYDDLDGMTLSAPVSITVLPGASGTVELQEGLNGYNGTRDTYLSTYSKNSNYGNSSLMYDETSSYTQLFQFAIFQREGGPVPDNAVIQAATLRVYKYSAYDPVYSVYRMLRPWDEVQATWNVARSGESWSGLGASAAGSDYLATADAQKQASWSAGWLEFDVSASLQAMQSGAGNYGWRLRRTGGDGANLKKLYSSEATADPGKRPMLVVTYAAP